MIGPDITRDAVLRVLSGLERETMVAVRNAAARAHTMSRGQFAHFVDNNEERLAVIAALTGLVAKLPPSAVLAKGETEAA